MDLAQEIAGLERALDKKFGGRPKGLAKGLRRAGRRLPKKAHQSGARLIEAVKKANHPKLAMTLDMDALGRDVQVIDQAIAAYDPKEVRKGLWLGLAGGLIFNLLVLVGLLLVAIWALG